MNRRRVILLLLLVVGPLGGALAGCGNSRTPVPRFGVPASPNGLRLLDLPPGVILRVPRSWTVTTAAPPLLATIFSGTAVVALWRYHRATTAPVGAAALARARTALLDAARRRDPALQPIRVAIITVGGRAALELDALEHLNGQLRRVRSVHIYVHGLEFVFDAYAPPAVFHIVDHAAFSPMKRSLYLVTPSAP